MNIYEIANLAGLSTATVSRVINNSDKVSPKAREKVREVIEKYGYTPSLVARELSTRKTNSIGIVIPGINSYFSGFIEAVSGVLRDNGYHLLVTSNASGVYDESEEIENLSFLARKRVDGIIVYVSTLTDLYRERIMSVMKNHRIVLINGSIEGLGIPSIFQDTSGGAEKLYRHLVAQGCRSLAYIRGPLYERTANERYETFKRVLGESGIALREELVRTGSFGYSSGYDAAFEIIRTGVPFDALACANDKMAIGALRALTDHGIAVPDDVLLAGYDDEEITRYTSPPITTIRQDQSRLGILSAELLIESINGSGAAKSIVMDQELIIRKSSKR